LDISRKAVKACGGEIRVRNLPGRGCTFTIDLPLVNLELSAATGELAALERGGR
jgi:signal transduction histidine kinase